jgi:type I restriction enzyme S subunit
MSDWKECKLGDVAEIVGGGTPSTKINDYWNGDIAWLTPRDLSNFTGRFISSGERNITKHGLLNSSARLLPKGSVLLSSRAPVGYLAIAKNEITTNQGFRSLIAKGNTTTDFLYYLLKNNVEYLKSQATGTTFGELAGSTLKSLTFNFPPLLEQRVIASVLSSLDDKIDLLHRENRTLEAMAETLFRQWFVEGADKRWEAQPIGDLFNISSGKGLKKEEFNDNGIYPVLGANGEIGRTDKYLFDGKLIFTGRVGTLGNVFIINNEKVWLSDNTLVIKPYNYFYSIYYILKTIKLEEYNVGSTQPLIRQSDIKAIEFALPSDATLKKFENEAELLFSKTNFNNKQIRTLEKLRDTLLPKLMSGEVRVKV